MCFENLPIVFDDTGAARLDGPLDLAFDTRRAHPAGPAPPSGPAAGFAFRVDPVTRVAGALAFQAQVDLKEGRVTQAYSEAVMFRGYELILRGRNPLEAIDISSRACGVCGGLMAAQGGRITVSSRVGQGSRFTLYFPVAGEGT